MGRKKKAKQVGSQLHVRTTAQLERELKDVLADPDPEGALDLSEARELAFKRSSPAHYIDGEPYDEEERIKQEAHENESP